MAFLDDLLGQFSSSGGLTPELGSMMAADPEAAARHLAARGVPPPPLGGQLSGPPAFGNSISSPLAAPNLSSFPSPVPVAPQAPSQAVTSYGAPSVASGELSPGGDPLAQAEGATGQNKIGDLAKALSGVKAPANPEFQKIRSPEAPRPSAMPQGSPIAALLAKAVAGDPTALMTLRTAIGGGR